MSLLFVLLQIEKVSRSDIFAFIQEYEGITFREAFVKLGGEYKYTSEEERKALQEKWKR